MGIIERIRETIYWGVIRIRKNGVRTWIIWDGWFFVSSFGFNKFRYQDSYVEESKTEETLSNIRDIE